MFLCRRGRAYSANSADEGKRRKTTSRVLESSDVCPFNFSVFYHHQLKLWFFPKESAGSKHHVGHPMVAYNLVAGRVNDLPEGELNLARDSLARNIPVSVITDQINMRNGVRLNFHQINNIRQSLVFNKNNKKMFSPAERLLEDLRSDPKMSYCMYTAEMGLGQGLLTVRKTKKLFRLTEESEIVPVSTKTKPMPAVTPVDDMDDNMDVGLVLRSVAGDYEHPDNNNAEVVDNDTVYTFANLVAKSLSLMNGEVLLLCLAWTSIACVRYFKMFPEKLGKLIVKTTTLTTASHTNFLLLTISDHNYFGP